MRYYHFKTVKTVDSKEGTGMHWLAEAQKSKRNKIKEHLNKLKQQRMDGRRRKTQRKNKQRQKQKKDVRKKRQKKMRNEKKRRAKRQTDRDKVVQRERRKHSIGLLCEAALDSKMFTEF